MLESRGIATVVVGLVRLHMEKTQPPRGLWVPFQLGRPFGDAEDCALQRRVLVQALRLLERRDGPVILEDFPDEAPSARANNWISPIALGAPVPPPSGDAASWAQAVGAEIAQVLPHWEKARQRFGRTTVGLSGHAPRAWAGYAANFLNGELPEDASAAMSPSLTLRYVADDLKALYMEAAQSEGPPPPSAALNAWFWNNTLAADLLRHLRAAALESPHNGFQTVGSRFLVPAPYVNRV
jgi:hypothetical protein